MFTNCELNIVTTSRPKTIENIINSPEYNNVKDYINIYYSITNFQEIYKECHFGLQLMSIEDSRVGVKIFEYIASGLIPLINSNVKGAVELLKKYDIGIIIPSNIVDYYKLANKLVEKLKDRADYSCSKNRIMLFSDVNRSDKVLNVIFH